MLISKLKEIDNLMMTRIGTKPVRAESAVVVDGMVVLRLPGGRWWCSWPNFEKFAHMPGLYGDKVQKLLRGLVALGVVEKSVAAEHVAWCRDIDEAREAKYRREFLEQIAAKYGEKPPKGLLRKIQAVEAKLRPTG